MGEASKIIRVLPKCYSVYPHADFWDQWVGSRTGKIFVEMRDVVRKSLIEIGLPKFQPFLCPFGGKAQTNQQTVRASLVCIA